MNKERWIKRHIILLTYSACIVFSAATIANDLNRRTDVLLPDFSFDIRCEKGIDVDFERYAEDFLMANGFRVVDLSRIQRKNRINMYAARVIGIDRYRTMIEMLSFPTTKNVLSVSLLSAPPTRHNEHLEGKILASGKAISGCAVQDISRNENGAESTAFFDSLVQRTESLYKETSSTR